MPRLISRSFVITVLAAGVALAAACSRQKPVVAPEPQAPTTMAQPAPSPGPGEVQQEPKLAPAQTPESGVSTGELPADLAELNKAGYLKDAFFDTNKSDLRPEARDVLSADATWLKAHPSVKIQVEGHCDERNTAEYNLALGWRRANAAKDYMVALGVDANRITTISYGEERPFATCHDESCWSQNRRAHVVITAR